MKTASATLEVAVLSWGLLSICGIIVFADDGFNAPQSMTQLLPKSAIDAFTNLFGNQLKRLYQGSAIALEKQSD